jgi:hypothetical protein
MRTKNKTVRAKNETVRLKNKTVRTKFVHTLVPSSTCFQNQGIHADLKNTNRLEFLIRA